ncbi:MAG TPA: ABC transporter transmembrane domain-containing protein [Hyphomicrobiaceae bacterium]|nr:ABC transporter transmembrane domain-containing protein [Hyphomicrobiaceae bacterium]
MAPKDEISTIDESGSEKKPRNLRPLAGLAPQLLRHRGALAGAAAALVVSALAMLAMPVAVRHMIDQGFSGRDGGSINRYFLILIGIGLVLAAASSTRAFLVNWLGERVVADVRRDVFSHLTTLSPAALETARSGEILSRLTADTTLVKSAAGSALSQAVRNLIMLIGAVAMMFVTSPTLTLVMLAAIPAIVLPLMGIGRIVQRLSRRAQDTLAEASAYAGENLSAVRTMQAYTHERTVVARFTSAVEAAFAASVDRLKARAGLAALTIALIVGSIVGVLWYGATMVVANEMTGGRLGQFVLYALFAGGALAELAEVWGEVSQAAGAAERLAELLALAPGITAPRDPLPMPNPARGAIELDRVSFSYPSRPEVKALDHIMLRIEPGETVAIVGSSGAGKSTIFNLLLRFYDPTAGEVRVDGVPTQRTDPKALRERFSIVPQEPALFADTVAENIRYGAPGASPADIERAAELAGALTFIRALPKGFETVLGERGTTLSGGQRQRVAIARAILRDAPILLLDEATSALDAESEASVQQALDAVMANRTTIVIAHRLATVLKAKRIIVMDSGRIVEEGTHAALVARGGLYSRLAALQFRAAAE